VSVDAQRRGLLSTALAGCLGVAPSCRAALAVASPTQRVSLALAARASLCQLPLILAEQLGYFRQAGLLIDWQGQEAGAHALARLASGHAEVVSGAFTHLLATQHKDLGLQAFVQLGRSPQLSLGLSSRRAVGAPTPAALRGLRIGVSALESNTHWTTCHWLQQAGVRPDEVVFVEVGASASAADALREGLVDALCNPDPLMHWLEHRGEVRILREAHSLASTQQLFGGAVPGMCLLARGDFLLRRPAVVQALTDGVVQALKWLRTAGPTDILRSVPASHWMGDRAIYLGAFEKLRESFALDGLIQEEAVSNAWRVHARLSAEPVPVRLSLGRTFTNQFASRAKSRFAV
jgi:NitT/TauT family transport system substrate-binding protein